MFLLYVVIISIYVQFRFSLSSYQYKVGKGCASPTERDFPVQPETKSQMVWQIFKTSKSLTIACNDVDLVTVVFAQGDEAEKCEKYWVEQNSTSIRFLQNHKNKTDSTDTASNYYREGKNIKIVVKSLIVFRIFRAEKRFNFYSSY